MLEEGQYRDGVVVVNLLSLVVRGGQRKVNQYSSIRRTLWERCHNLSMLSTALRRPSRTVFVLL